MGPDGAELSYPGSQRGSRREELRSDFSGEAPGNRTQDPRLKRSNRPFWVSARYCVPCWKDTVFRQPADKGTHASEHSDVSTPCT